VSQSITAGQRRELDISQPHSREISDGLISIESAAAIVRNWMPGGEAFVPVADGIVRELRREAATSWRQRVVATAFRD
jgi:hypothetical protein